MLKRYFISNIIVIMILNVIVKPLWIFLIDRNVQLNVGHEEYGIYSALVSLTIMFNILLDLGITNMNNRNLSANSKLLSFTLPNMLCTKLILLFLYTTVISILGLVLGYTGRIFNLLLLLSVVQMLNSMMQFLRSNVSAHHDFKLDSVLSVLDKLIMILICSYLLFSTNIKSQFKLEWFIYAQLFSYSISIVFALLLIIKRYHAINFGNLSIKTMFSLSRQSLPYALLILLMGVYMRSDSLILERMEGATQNSYYAATYRVLDIANMSGFLFAGILLPMFSRLIANKLSVKELIITSTNILVSISLGIVAFCWFYSSELMHLLYPTYSQWLPQLFRLTIISFPAFSLMYIFSTLLTANGNIRLMIRIALFGSILSLILNLFLIKHFKAEGAAMATMIVEWILALVYIYHSIKIAKLKFKYSWIQKFILLFFSIIIVNFILHYFHINLFVAIILNFVSFFGLVYTLKIWDKFTIVSYLNQLKSS